MREQPIALIGVCGYDGKTYSVKPRCEVVMKYIANTGDAAEFCRKPTKYFYPAQGGGTMPLCEEHGQRHLPHGAWPVTPAEESSNGA